MEISIVKKGGIAIFALMGHFNPEGEDELAQAIDNLINQGNSKIVVNMESITAVNSQGLSILIAAQKKAKKAGGNIKFSNPQSYIRELFELTRLHTIFDIYDSDEEAAASF